MFCKYAANIQEDTHPECDFWKVENQLYWNHTSAWVFCTFAAYLQKSCFDEHLWGTTSASFYSTCLSNFWLNVCVKFGLFSNIFLNRSMFSSERAVLHLAESSLFLFRVVPYERYFALDCLFARWCLIKSSKCCLNYYVAFSFEKFFCDRNLFFLDIWDIVSLNLPQESYFRSILTSELNSQITVLNNQQLVKCYENNN